MPLANYTTTVPTSRSIQWITELLADAKAQAILFDYDNGQPVAVTFRIDRAGMQMGFKLPCDWKKTYAVLCKSKGVPQKLRSEDHAKRVAWRCVHDWLRAQIALIEIGAVELEQVMLPYAVTSTGETVYEKYRGNGFLQLCPPS